MMFMDEMSRCQKGLESVQFSDITAASLLFADDVVLLISEDDSGTIFKCETSLKGANSYSLKVPFARKQW